MAKYNRVGLLSSLCGTFLACSAGIAGDGSVGGSGPEPTAELACRWWPEFENVWTPLGWKDHPLRFNVVYNGILVAEPLKKPFIEQGVQLTFIPSADGAIPKPRPTKEPYRLCDEDGGPSSQGWNEGAAPVLWTEWRQDGFALRSEIFAHIAGPRPVRTGAEPLFAWIRLSISKAGGSPGSARYGWLVRINNPHIQKRMSRKHNLVARPEIAAYPRKLSGESSSDVRRHGYRLIEPGGKVRLGMAPGAECSVRFIDREPDGTDAFLYIEMLAEKGRHVDLLLPVLPTDRPVFDAELRLGFDKALEQTERYWGQVPETAARIETPERLINQAIRHSVKFAEVIAERNAGAGQYSLLSGSWHYEKLWATPTSMICTMILDTLGYHSAAEKYLEIFKDQQGTVTPPGDAYKPHPGYLSTPKTFTSIDWLSDHGAILHAICHHALVSGDRKFTNRWIDTIIKACEFIRDARAITGHGGVEGILPPAVATDRRLQTQAVWNDGWNYEGLVTAVRLLQQLGHPRAEELAREARTYRQAFVTAMREAAGRMPQWVDDAGRAHHFVPTALPDGGDVHHPFYLDTGPLFLVYAGLMDPDDQLMRSAVRYFREGPNTRNYDIDGNWDQPVCLHHEVSSCEPCYSWNVFHSHQLGDRYRFLEGMYSLFVGAMSRQTFIGCEHRGGISGTLFPAPLAIYLARLAVIDDQIRPGELHLLRLVPLAWLQANRPARFENMPTEFGPLTLRFSLQKEGTRLEVMFEPEFRHQPARVWLHVPPLAGLGQVSINSKVLPAKPDGILPVE